MRLRSSFIAICLIAVSGCFSETPVFAAQAPRVAIDTGILQGTRSVPRSDAAEFLGIPYAAPPLGDLRWKPPAPAKKWSGLRSADQFGAACPQLPAKWFPDIGWNEDCLYLNVWTPELSARKKLPVLVYFHGGSNTQGYAHMNPLGPELSKFGLVVVSANYRLGPFGFMAHPALTAESEHHSSGNYGLLDQIQALHWVRRNISQFGGDPAQVTVMGQSAGAVDICLLMASPLARGLFERAIMQSGECQSVFNKDIRVPIPYNFISGTGEAAGERLANDLGATGPHVLQKLRSLPPAEILDAWQQDRSVHFDAIVDGWVVPEQPAKIFAEGKQLHIPVLVGSNADEATVFGHGDMKTVDQYRDYLLRDSGEYATREFQAYPVSSDADVMPQYIRLRSDTFAYGAYSIAQSMSRTGQQAFLYYFTHAEQGKRASLGAYHGEELNFLSNSFPADWEHAPDDEKFGQTLRVYWTQFAKTGNPNAHGLPIWQAYDEHSGMSFESGRSFGPRPVSHQVQSLQETMTMVLQTQDAQPSISAK